MPNASTEKQIDSLLKEKDSYQSRAKKLLSSLDKEIATLTAKRDALASMLGGSAPRARRGRPRGSAGTRKATRRRGSRKRVKVAKGDLKALLAQGMTSKQIAEHYGVAAMTVAGWKAKFKLTKPRKGKKTTKKTAKKTGTKKKTSR